MAREGEGPHVKICGVTTVDDALMCVELGASAIGLNFVRESPRRITAERARQISRAVGDRALVVGVIAGLDVDDARTLVSDAGLGCLQLHGDETPETLAGLLPHAYKALRVASIADVARAADYAGEYLLVDAKVDGALGGTGHTFDWSLVTDLAAARKLTLAGGLTPENVAEAARAVRPFCVDVASGVELAPGRKDPARVRAFVEAARAVSYRQ
ncbi:MAG: phosphoribosylanthranilate isomerase [Myxococcales bacterium]|nr:phosphoribosylanthranilate isomerase [Myxococcales bacterium]